jgi:hypothetical protein
LKFSSVIIGWEPVGGKFLSFGGPGAKIQQVEVKIEHLKAKIQHVEAKSEH